jgi:putative transposase
VARLTRLALAGELHHLGIRGHNGQAVFADDADREAFVSILRESALAHRVAIHAYVLLDSEVQLLAAPRQDHALGRMVQSLGRRYVRAFNRRHGRRGALWDGRFRSSLVEGSSVLVDATVYVESLPVSAGLVSDPAQWRWSSAAHHVGRCRDPLVTEHEAYWATGNTPFERELAHANRLALGLPAQRDAQLNSALQRGYAVGSAEFIAAVADRAGRRVLPAPRGRPRKPMIVSPFNS